VMGEKQIRFLQLWEASLTPNSEFISFFPDLMEYFEHYVELILVLQVKPIEAS